MIRKIILIFNWQCNSVRNLPLVSPIGSRAKNNANEVIFPKAKRFNAIYWSTSDLEGNWEILFKDSFNSWRRITFYIQPTSSSYRQLVTLKWFKNFNISMTFWTHIKVRMKKEVKGLFVEITFAFNLKFFPVQWFLHKYLWTPDS